MPMRPLQFLKSMLDMFFAAAALLLLAPVLLLCAVLNLVLNGRPIMYHSRRHVGVDRAIHIPKFRTMVKDATSDKYQLEARFMRKGFLDIPLGCEVYTPFGRVLERLQIVEVPQFLCVLKGEMSIIGNRPLPAANLEYLKAMPGWEQRFDSPAGITGIAQVVGKLALQPKERLRLEGLYSDVYQNGNVLKLDCLIALLTIRVVLFAKGTPLDVAENYLQSCLPRAVLDARAKAQTENLV